MAGIWYGMRRKAAATLARCRKTLMRKRASPVMPCEKSQSRRSPNVFFWSSDMMENTRASHCSAESGSDSWATSLPRTRNMGGRPTCT